MLWKKLSGLATFAAVFGVVAVAGGGCSSSNSAGGATPGDGGDSPTVVDDGGDDGRGRTFDGTTGKACSTDADCTNSGGPGINKCSNDGFFSIGTVLSSGTCLMPPVGTQGGSNCNPGQDGNAHYCDGPDDPSSPGICVPSGPNAGVCLPKCVLQLDGTNSPPVGCIGKNACTPLVAPVRESNGTLVGLGYCFGGCETSADCDVGQCDPSTGYCVTTPAPPSLPVGAECSSNNQCNCFTHFDPSSSKGICTYACTTGRDACPSGWVCEIGIPRVYKSSAPPGMAGVCVPSCSLDGGTGSDAGVCPPGTSCRNTLASGPDCVGE